MQCRKPDPMEHTYRHTELHFAATTPDNMLFHLLPGFGREAVRDLFSLSKISRIRWRIAFENWRPCQTPPRAVAADFQCRMNLIQPLNKPANWTAHG